MQKLQFSAKTKGPRLLITAGVHGDEFEGITAVHRLRQGLADASIELLAGELTLIPVVNESAFLCGNRCGEDRLDLARTCPGRVDGTITQRTAWELSEAICDHDFYIDLHTGGTEFSVWPLAGYGLHSQPAVLEQQRRMATAFNLPVVWGTSGKHNGRSLSVARDANVPAIYCEYLGGGQCSPDGVEAYVDGCLNVMSLLSMVDRPQAASRVEHVVEDHRPDSGHMQVCNPSPATGLWIAKVGLGQKVSRGSLLGTVTEPALGDSHDVRATESGHVLVLRSFPRVLQGESVGVILPDLDEAGAGAADA